MPQVPHEPGYLSTVCECCRVDQVLELGEIECDPSAPKHAY